MAKDLSVIFQYNKIKPVVYMACHINKLRLHPISSKEDWNSDKFTSIKTLIRRTHYRSQNRRCAYCRRRLNPLGVNEHIDHLVARKLRFKWMFKPRNLVLCCYQCNTQKSSASIFERGAHFKRLPKKGHNYVLFNPYVHRWSDHFEIDGKIFLRAKSIEGQNTITELKLYYPEYSIIYLDEANISAKSAIKRATLRMRNYPSDSIEFRSAKKLITQITAYLE